MARAGLRGKPYTLQRFRKELRKLPTQLAQQVAASSAPVLTKLAGDAYDQGRTVYGTARPLGVTGEKLDLVETNTTRRNVRFAATGTVVRCVLGPKYAKYLIGKYSVLPSGAIPVAWANQLRDIARTHLTSDLQSVVTAGGEGGRAA